MKNKYSVTLYALTMRIACYKDGSCLLVNRWKRVAKYYFALKKEALSYVRQHAGYYVKATLRREVK